MKSILLMPLIILLAFYGCSGGSVRPDNGGDFKPLLNENISEVDEDKIDREPNSPNREALIVYHRRAFNDRLKQSVDAGMVFYTKKYSSDVKSLLAKYPNFAFVRLIPDDMGVIVSQMLAYDFFTREQSPDWAAMGGAGDFDVISVSMEQNGRAVTWRSGYKLPVPPKAIEDRQAKLEWEQHLNTIRMYSEITKYADQYRIIGKPVIDPVLPDGK